VSTSVVKWSEGLSNRASVIIRRYTDQMKFVAYMVVPFIIFFSYSSRSILYHCTYGCMFCMFLFSFVNYVFLLLRIRLCLCILIVMYSFMFMYSYCYVYSVLSILIHCVVLCIVCV